MHVFNQNEMQKEKKKHNSWATIAIIYYYLHKLNRFDSFTFKFAIFGLLKSDYHENEQRQT